jgi:SecD/SecF fusion protein
MNSRILWTVVAVILAGLWALSSSVPFQTTPFRQYAWEQLNPADPAIRKQATDLFAKADEALKEKKSTSFYGAFKTLVQSDKVDIQTFYPQLNATDVRNLTKRNDLILSELLKRSQSKFRLGLDLAGGVSFTFKVDVSKIKDDYARKQALDKAKEILLQRVDGLGVAEPVVRIVGDDSIEIQMPGLSLRENPQVADTLQAPAMLEFCLVNRSAIPGRDEVPLGYRVMTEEREDMATGKDITEQMYIKKMPEMTGSSVSQAGVQVSQTGAYSVGLTFTKEGAKRFGDITQAIADENAKTGTVGRLAIILDGKLYSSPTVREAILGGSAEISGSFSQREAMELANVLNNPLEVGLKMDSMVEVGPTLADQARDASLCACVIGCAVVAFFMIGYYSWLGVIAMVGVAYTIFLILGTMAGIGSTFSLPGISALVLTVGMAVDSNILIFERMREELKSGKDLRHAHELGHARAFSTIFDANLTTLLTSVIMVWFGVGPVKGFGVILSLGIVATLFSVLLFCRMLQALVIDNHLAKKALPHDWLQVRNVDFMKAAPIAFTISWAIIIFGVYGLVAHFDKAWGIDFKGGEELVVSYAQKLSPIDIAKSTKGLGEVNPIYQNVLGTQSQSLRLQANLGKGQAVLRKLQADFPKADLKLISTSTIGASVGAEVQRGAIVAIVAAFIATLLYVAFRFELGYGVGAVIATLHDLLMTIGMYVLLGEQFTAPMIAALLLVIGYSINETVVVFDRIREELRLNPHLNLAQVINLSVNVTLSRTILKSLTVFLATVALCLFGAGVVREYALVFMIGVVTGTYSAIFIASPIFYWWHRGDRKTVEERADPVRHLAGVEGA